MSAHDHNAWQLPPFGWDGAASNVVDMTAVFLAPAPHVDSLAPDVAASLKSAHSRLVGVLAAMDALLITPSEPLFRTLALNVDELLELAAGEFSDAMTAAGLRLR